LLVLSCHRGATSPGAVADGAPAREPAAADPAEAAAAPLRRHVARTASFRLADVELSIEDLHLSTALDEVLRRHSAALVVNGGFFDERGEPLGLAVTGGATLSRFSPFMSGGVLWVRGEAAHLTATEEYREAAVDFAVQCRPRLVVGFRGNIRSDDGRRAARTAICLREGGQRLDFVMALADGDDGGPTLYELAAELVATGCEEALNLDGGPSTGWAQSAGPFFRAPVAPVRHAVVVRKR
jgi:uncharacterized protein YigE (DUF2233 family)